MRKGDVIGSRYVLSIVAACVVFFLMGVSGPALGAKQIVLKGVSTFPRNNVYNKHIPILIKMIEKDSGGRIKINWLGGPEVIKGFDQPESLKRGVIDIGLGLPFAFFKSLMPVSLARGLSECSPQEERENGTYALWDKIWQEKANAKYLGTMYNDIPFNIFSKKKIEKLDDLRGLNIRIMPLYAPFLKKVGAGTVTLPMSEVYTALQRGVVDGLMFPLFISDFGWQEIVKYAIVPGVFCGEMSVCMNLDTWNKLPKDLQEVIINSVKKLESSKLLVEEEKAEWAKQEKAGLKKITLPQEEAKKLHDIAYEETWKEVIRIAPAYGPKFRELTSPCKK